MIYLDNCATTRVDPRVVEAMLPFFTETYGNPTSDTHYFGWEASEAVEEARYRVAKLINAKPENIIFTSGATESNNLVLHNFQKIISSNIEHSSILVPLSHRQHILVKVLPNGLVDIDALIKKAGKAKLVSVMLANNEIGVIQPIEKIKGKFKVHTDMTQAVGKMKIDVNELGVDYASFSSHKIYGPKGVGALYFKENDLTPMIYGGNQEYKLRSGTLNVPAIVGFGKACEILNKEIDQDIEHMRKLRDRFESKMVGVFHKPDNRLVNISSVSISCKDMTTFIGVLALDVAVSMGSACMRLKTSHVLEAIGVEEREAQTTIRVSFGRFNTEEEVDLAIGFINNAVNIGNGG